MLGQTIFGLIQITGRKALFRWALGNIQELAGMTPACPCYPLTPDMSDDGPLWNNDVKLQADGTVTLIDDSVFAEAYGVRVGNGGANNVLHVTGGRLDIGGTPPTGGSRTGWHLQVGRGYPGFDGGPANVDPTATVLMSGGTINTNGC